MMERSLGYVQILSSACSLSQMWLWHVVQICILLTALPSFLLWKEEAKASRCWKWKHKMCLVKTSHFRSWCTMQVCIYWCQLGYQVSSSKRQKKIICKRQSRNDFFKLSSKEQTKEFYFTTMKPCFSLFFVGNWRHQKDISKSTGIYEVLILAFKYSNKDPYITYKKN